MILQFLIFVSILSGGLCSTCSNLTKRLPKHAIPTEYQLWLQPNLTTGNVDGEVFIGITIASSTNQIVLHARNLTMILYNITINDKKVEAQFIPCDNLNYWAFNLDHYVKKGDNVVLHMDYIAQISHGDHGMFYTPHTDSNGTIIRSAITKMEPEGARLLLPCFDEPNLKAIFHVSITRDPFHLAVSNMAVIESNKTDDGLIIDYFEPTPIMSTYLLAVAILDGYSFLGKYTTKTEHPVQARVYAPDDLIEHAKLGIDTMARSLEYFEAYTNISYPLEKLDATVATKYNGAMENWGMMVFQPSYLTPDNLDESSRETVVRVVCHEVAHQWFGNIVTMDWWDEIYLNEGFASYMETKCFEELFPEWNTKNGSPVFGSQEADWSYQKTGQARPVISDNVTNLSYLFDYLPYGKANAIINMIAETVGESNFQMAMREYLKNNLYSNTKSVDVWSVVEKYSKDYYSGPVSLQSFVHGWMSVAGFPYVRVTRKGDMVTVYNQTQYLASGDGKASNWTIPLFYKTYESKERKLEWMSSEAKNVSWKVDPSDWMILNTGGVGYFKPLYDEDMYKNIKDQLLEDHTKISTVDRQMILFDAYYFVSINLLDVETYMALLMYARKENDKQIRMILQYKHFSGIEALLKDKPKIAALFKSLTRMIQMEWKERKVEKAPLQRKMGLEEGVKMLNEENTEGLEKFPWTWEKNQMI